MCCYDDTYSKQEQVYRGEDSINKFIQQMLTEVQYCQKIISTKFKKPLQMTDEDEQQFKAAEEYHMCGQQYKGTDIRVRQGSLSLGSIEDQHIRTVI